MKRTCIKEFEKDGLTFHKGVQFEIAFNYCNNKFYIYHPFGHIEISKEIIDYYFI